MKSLRQKIERTRKKYEAFIKSIPDTEKLSKEEIEAWKEKLSAIRDEMQLYLIEFSRECKLNELQDPQTTDGKKASQ
jgi:hypothetical protein